MTSKACLSDLVRRVIRIGNVVEEGVNELEVSRIPLLLKEGNVLTSNSFIHPFSSPRSGSSKLCGLAKAECELFSPRLHCPLRSVSSMSCFVLNQ